MGQPLVAGKYIFEPVGKALEMTWQDTAKRLAAHPEWEWLEGMQATCPEGRSGRIPPNFGPEIYDIYGAELFPVLTDWPTVGVLLGMVRETGCVMGLSQDREYAGWPWEVWAWDPNFVMDGRPHYEFSNYKHPGQALAELWLELKGEKARKSGNWTK